MSALSVLIIYASVGGNTELVVQKVTQVLQNNNISTTLIRAEKAELKHILDSDLTILASPTYYHGEVEINFVPFLQNAEKLDLTGKKFAVIGLGDKKYYPEYLCDSAQVLEDFVSKVGGDLAVSSLRIGTSPVGLLESMVKNWAERLGKNILENLSKTHN